MEKPTIYRGDGYLPDALYEVPSSSLGSLIPKLEAAVQLGADVELITEFYVADDVVQRRFRLKVFPRMDSGTARDALANIALQQEQRRAAFEGLHGPAGGAYAEHTK